MRPVAFLDRDGTINEEKIYLSHPADFHLLPGAAQAIKRLNRAGWAVVVVTNQSGLARGYFSPETLQAIHRRLEQALAQAGAGVDGIYLCPHHPDDGCTCRKPGTALFKQAAADMDLDLRHSVIIGDKMSDLEPGSRLGCKTVLVLTGHGTEAWAQRHRWTFQPDVVVKDLAEAVAWLLAA